MEDGDGYNEEVILAYIQSRIVRVVTLCLEACVCEVVGFRFSSSDLELGLDKVLLLLFLGFGGFSHGFLLVYGRRGAGFLLDFFLKKA